jgi:endoglucanase
MQTRLLGYILIGASLLLAVGVLFFNSKKSTIPLVFSPVQMQNVLWERYKTEYLEPETMRTLDKQRDNVTTSEGQSYTMLRAVWMSDKETFDASWQWTKDNLDRPNDRLFAWLFGQQADGSYGILTQRGGDATASDADQDIALALIFAYARWQDPVYLGDARVIIADMWEQEIITIAGKPYLAANNYEKFSPSQTAIINPSYLAPYAYRIFAIIDPAHPWESVADSSYDILARSMEAEFGGASAGLPPDWVRINKTTGALSIPEDDLTTNFGYDALRTPWRLALDWQWFRDERAKNLLEKMKFFSEEWEEKRSLATTYAHDGSIVTPAESPAMYGATLGYFTVADTANAKEVYEEKILFLYNPDRLAWKEVLSYYDDNWIWFGFSLYNNLLPNLAQSLPPSAYER